MSQAHPASVRRLAPPARTRREWTPADPDAAVVTGLGVVAPTGIGSIAYWAATLRGELGIRRMSRVASDDYPVRLAGEVQGFDAADHLPRTLSVQTDHWTHLGLVAADEALTDAAVHAGDLPEYELAVVTASSSGGTEFGQREIERLWSKGPSFVSAYQSIAWFYAATTGQISIRNGMRGPCGVLAAEQAGGLDAAGYARTLLTSGTRLVVAGGTDASLSPYGLVAQISAERLSTQEDPARGYLPFDTDAAGHVPGEGGAMLVMERAGQAAARGAPSPYGEIAGYAASFDPHPRTGRPPALAQAMRGALEDARTAAAEVDVVFADAAGNAMLDRAEATAIREVFGRRGVPVTAPKTMVGRLYAGGAALDLATALLAMRDQVVPPTVGIRNVAPWCDLALVLHEPQRRPVRVVLVIARGYGGFNSAVVLRKSV